MVDCGYTPAQIRAMYYADYVRLTRYFRRHPPPGIMLEIVARCLGWKPRAYVDETDLPEGTFDEKIAAVEQDLSFGDVSRFFKPGYGTGVKDDPLKWPMTTP